MSAQPIDPHDPEHILYLLPERDRRQFLDEYRAAVDGAHEVAGYRKLQQVLHLWSLVAVAHSQPDFFQRAEQARNWQEHPELFTAIEEIVPDWAERVERARRARQ